VGDPLVTALDGLEDAPMVRVRARGPARRVERFLSTPGPRFPCSLSSLWPGGAGPVQWIPGGALEDGRLAALPGRELRDLVRLRARSHPWPKL